MTKKTWKRIYKAGAIASIGACCITAWIAFAPVEQTEVSEIRTTGNTARDVVQALSALGELDGAAINPTSSLARQAIADAERRLGLPQDGIADRTLFDRLSAEVYEQSPEAGLTLDDGVKLTSIVTGISTLVLGVLGFRREKAAKS